MQRQEDELLMRRLLMIDLTTRQSRVEQIAADDLLGLGGKALALAVLERHLDPRADPLSPDNPVVLTPSPLSTYGFSGSNRFGAFAKSPLTGAILESYSGGTLARTLAETGWDAVVITGASATPVRLVVDNEGTQIHAAGELWGLDVFAADDLLSADLPRRAGSMVIGVAGERLSAISSVQVEKYHSLGRGGLGAVFGSKRLKAVTVRSAGPVRNEGSEAFNTLRHKVSHLATDSPAANAYRGMGTSMMVALLNEAQGFPADYWRAGTVEHRATLEAENFSSWATVATGTCPPCPMRCRRVITVNEGPEAGRTIHGPEYETLYSFGGLCMVEHARDVLRIHEECNRLGMDTISAGNLVALAMVAAERGDLAAPAKGDTEAIMALLNEMAGRSSELGDLLSQGIRPAADALGLSDEAIHVKGMEPAGYDPRALRGMALAYATSPRGACHLRATFYKPILGGLTKDLDDEALATLFIDFEDRLFLFDCLIMCRFYRDFLTWEDLALATGELAGRTVTVDELKTLAGRLLDQVRRLNFSFGLTAADDRLPRRFFTEALGEKPALGEEEFQGMLTAYYLQRGWGEEGVPPREESLAAGA
jgi:aldehyde:ferredoxin oxidoreductase